MTALRRTGKKLGEILVEQGKVSPLQIHKILKLQEEIEATKGYRIRLGELLLKERLVSSRDLARAFATQFDIDFVELKGQRLEATLVAALSPDWLERWQFCPLERGDGWVSVAVDDEPSPDLYTTLAKCYGADLRFKAASRSELDRFRSAAIKQLRLVASGGQRALNLASIFGSSASPSPDPPSSAMADEGGSRAAQRKFSAGARVSIADGIEDITDLPAPLPELEDDGLVFESGDALAGFERPATDPSHDIDLRPHDGGPKKQRVNSDADLDDVLDRLAAEQEAQVLQPIDDDLPEADLFDLPEPDFSMPEPQLRPATEFMPPPQPAVRREAPPAPAPMAPPPPVAPPRPEPTPAPLPIPQAPPPAPTEEAPAPRPSLPEPELPFEAAPPEVDPFLTDEGPSLPEIGEAPLDEPEKPSPAHRPDSAPEAQLAPKTPPSAEKNRKGMNPLLKQFLLQAIEEGCLGLTFVHEPERVAIYGRGATKQHLLGELLFRDFGDVVSYLSRILKLDLPNLSTAARKKIKLKVGNEAHLFQFLFSPTLPLSIAVNIEDPSRSAHDLGTLGIDPDVVSELRGTFATRAGLTLFTGQTRDATDDLYFATLAHLAQEGKRVVSYEPELCVRVPGIEQFEVPPDSVRAETLYAAENLRGLLDGRVEVLALRETPDPDVLARLVNLALSEMHVVVCLEARDALSGFMRVKKAGVSTSSLLQACDFIVHATLVNKLCPFCKGTYLITREQIPEKMVEVQELVDLKAYHAPGCEACRNSGSSGTTTLFETCQIDSQRIDIDELTRARKPLKTHLLENGMLRPLASQARKALLSGVIDLNQFLAIVRRA